MTPRNSRIIVKSNKKLLNISCIDLYETSSREFSLGYKYNGKKRHMELVHWKERKNLSYAKRMEKAFFVLQGE